MDTDTINNKSYITVEEAEKKFGSKGIAGTGLGLGIAGTALALLNNGIGLFNKDNTVTTTSDNQQYLERKQNSDYIQITKEYYEGKIESLKELSNSIYTLDQKIQSAKDIAATESRENFDALNKRIIDLEKSDAVLKATQPLYQQINDLKLNFVNQSAQNGISSANALTSSLVSQEAERRRCGDNCIINYANSTFYPKLIAGVTPSTTYTNQPIYNPLLPQMPQV